MTAVPIVLNFHFERSIGRSLRLDLYAGACCALATFRQDVRTSTDFFLFEESESFEARKTAFGGQAGIALAFDLGSGVDFFVQAEGRQLVLMDLMGDATSEGSWFLGSWTGAATTAYLWSYNLTESGKTYPQIAVAQSTPSGTGISGSGKAQIDLGGVTLSAGIRIRL